MEKTFVSPRDQSANGSIVGLANMRVKLGLCHPFGYADLEGVPTP